MGKMTMTLGAILALFLLTASATTPPPPPPPANSTTVPNVTITGTSTLTLSTFVAKAGEDYNVRLNQIKNNVDTELDVDLQKIAKQQTRIIVVAKQGKANFRTITDAVKSIPNGSGRRVIVKIGPGVYKEKIKIERTKKFVMFYGDPDNMPTISYNAKAASVGTWDSATVVVESHYFIASNIIFENTSPMPRMGAQGGQAVALRISGDKAAFYNCKFLGYQDTLLDDKGYHYFKDCYIRGMEDFIFGNGRSIYKNCTIESVSKEGMTAITAQGRATLADKSGFSFINCRVIGTGHAYLSRAWRASARVVFAYTFMGELVNPKGWDNYGDVKNDDSVFYGEYKCSGPGAITGSRAKFAKTLTDAQVKPFLSMTFIRAGTWLQPPPVVE